MAAPKASFSELYNSACTEHQIQINPHILEVLETTPFTGRNIILNLSGRKWQKSVQKLNDRDAFVISKCLKNYMLVTGLDMSYNHITDEGVKHLADLLRGTCSLTSLRLSGNKIGENGAMLLAMTLPANSSLMELELSTCDLGIQSVVTFANVLKSNKTLRCLDFSRALLNGHEEYWVVHIANMLMVNSSLLELHLGMTGLADTGMEKLAEGLKMNRSLRYLDLQYNGVSCKGAFHLAEVLKKSKTLDIVDLSFNRLEDQGALYLGKVLSSPSCGLRALSVSWNNIRSDGLLALAQAVRFSPSLTHINIWGNYLEDPVCQAFQELIFSGRLLRDQTDVTAYEMDDQVFLAEVRNTLKKLHHRINFSTYDNIASHFSLCFFKKLG